MLKDKDPEETRKGNSTARRRDEITSVIRICGQQTFYLSVPITIIPQSRRLRLKDVLLLQRDVCIHSVSLKEINKKVADPATGHLLKQHCWHRVQTLRLPSALRVNNNNNPAALEWLKIKDNKKRVL